MPGEIVDGAIVEMLRKVIDARAELDEITAAQKAARARLEDLERRAADAIASCGIDAMRCHGRTWKPVMEVSVNVVQADRDKIIAAARSVGLDVVQASTSKIKAWLIENQKRRLDEGEAPADYAEGTVFDGLVREYRRIGLSSVKAG